MAPLLARLLVAGMALSVLTACNPETRPTAEAGVTVAGVTVAGVPTSESPLPPPDGQPQAEPDAFSQGGRANDQLAKPPALREPSSSQAADAAATGADQSSHRSTPQRRGVFRLPDAVANAVLTYPEIRINEARTREARAGISVATAGIYPSADLRLAIGPNFSGSYEGTTIPYRTSDNAVDARLDGSVILRQLLFNFGATSSDIRRAELLRDSETWKLRDKIDEVALKTTRNYLRVLEQRALLQLVDEIITAHVELARVVQAQETEGHGTVADVQRVNSRLVDVRAIRTDISLEIKAAEDQLERLTRQKPLALAAPPDVRTSLPPSPARAIEAMLSNNPRLAALETGNRSSRKELETQQAGALPTFNLEIEADTKNFRDGPAGRAQAEARAMVAMRYRFLDGGLATATQQQTRARIESGEASLLNEREQIEADIRQAYRAIESAGRKLRLIADGVQSAQKVRELYLEQFKGGRRTVFELLDSQMSVFTIRRNQIESQYEGHRAMFDILRATGTLTNVLAGKA